MDPARNDPWVLHPFPAALLGGTWTLFTGALLSDLAYWSSYQIQWSNFASWLVAGALLIGAIVLVWTWVGLLRSRRSGRGMACALVLLLAWLLGFYNALVHARDAWAAMPTGLVLSLIVFVLACIATWLGFSSLRADVRASMHAHAGAGARP